MSQPLVVRIGVYPHRAEETVAWERDAFQVAGCTYQFLEASDPQGQIEQIRDADAIVFGGGGRWDEAVFAQLERCQVLMSCSVGIDWIDVDAATRHRVNIVHIPDMCTDEVADHTLALLLACVRKIPALSARVQSGIWDRSLLAPMPRLRGRTLGLLGFGRIARQVADRARGFGLAIITFDPVVDAATAAAAGARLVDLETLLRESDVLSVHTPLMASTRGLIGAEAFRLMKPSSYLINTSRGPVVDEAALIEALRSGQIRGAGLDVLEHEPPHADNPLLRMDNVVVTAHAAGFSDEVVESIPRVAVREVLAVLQNGAPSPAAWANRAALQATAS